MEVLNGISVIANYPRIIKKGDRFILSLVISTFK